MNILRAKSIIYLVLVATIIAGPLVTPLTTSAASVKYGNNVSVSATETEEEDLYIAGENILINGDLIGDLTAIGGKIFSDGNISEDILAFAGNFILSGPTGDDVRALAGSFSLLDLISGDLFTLAAQVYTGPDSMVSGDVFIFSGSTSLDGDIGGSLSVYGENANINGTVSGDVFASADRLTIGPKANIAGDVTYRSELDPVIDPEAVIAGTLARDGDAPSGDTSRVATWLTLAILKMIAYVFMALLILYIARDASEDIIKEGLSRFGYNMIFGLAFVVFVPIAGFILSITLIGIPLAMLMFMAYGAMFIIGFVFATMLLGFWAYRNLFKGGDAYKSPWKPILLGAVLFIVLTLIPFFGWLFKLAFVLAAFGAISVKAWQGIRSGIRA